MKVNAILKHLLINVATELDELLQLFEYGGFFCRIACCLLMQKG